MSQNNGRRNKMDETTLENADLTESKSLTQLQEDFHAATRKWRKQINNLSCQLVNDRNVESLEKGSQVLVRVMSELTKAQEGLDKALKSEVERITLFGKFEAFTMINFRLRPRSVVENLGKVSHPVIL